MNRLATAPNGPRTPQAWPEGLRPYQHEPLGDPPPNPRLRALKQAYDDARREEDMTVCIGALAWDRGTNQNCIVLCCDYKVSNEEFSSETQYKFQTLSDGLAALFADSMGRAKELVDYYRAYLPKEQLSRVDLPDQLLYPVMKLKHRLARSYVCRRLGVTYEEFLAKGPKWFGKERYNDYLTKSEDHPLRVQFIVAGFLGDQPVLYEFRGEDIERCPIMATIGSGAYVAELTMHRREHDHNTPLAQALYNVYEAKKLSETSPSVGTRTRMIVLRPPEGGNKRITVQRVTEEGEDQLAKLFAEYGPKPMVRIPVLVENALGASLWSAGLSD